VVSFTPRQFYSNKSLLPSLPPASHEICAGLSLKSFESSGRKNTAWFAGNIITLPWLSTSLPSHIMHIYAVSVSSMRESNIKNDHELIEGHCVAGHGYETISMPF
jgi:hypothetical protein